MYNEQTQQPQQLAAQFAQRFQMLAQNIERIIRGKHEAIELALICLLSEGHLLIEDVPGTGKTTLARSIAAIVDAEWRRIQFTPDLLPSDITGMSSSTRRTRVRVPPGPVFANIVLADEINRASPKTQSALLEVDGGAPGHGRRRDAPACPGRSW